jgi:hypothetical protein
VYEGASKRAEAAYLEIDRVVLVQVAVEDSLASVFTGVFH